MHADFYVLSNNQFESDEFLLLRIPFPHLFSAMYHKDEERTAKEWIKEHKTELICGGIGIAAVVGILFGIKNRDAIKTVVKVGHNVETVHPVLVTISEGFTAQLVVSF